MKNGIDIIYYSNLMEEQAKVYKAKNYVTDSLSPKLVS